jgi:hypothetical protein
MRRWLCQDMERLLNSYLALHSVTYRPGGEVARERLANLHYFNIGGHGSYCITNLAAH